MSYLLDTNVVVALLRNKPSGVRDHYRRTEASGAYLAVSSIVLYELWYGVAKSAWPQRNAERLRVFLSGGFDVVAFDDEDAVAAGQVRAALEAAGTPIGPYDVLIAGQALRGGLTLATASVSEFSRVPDLHWRVPDLHWEDWAT